MKIEESLNYDTRKNIRVFTDTEDLLKEEGNDLEPVHLNNYRNLFFIFLAATTSVLLVFTLSKGRNAIRKFFFSIGRSVRYFRPLARNHLNEKRFSKMVL